MKKKLSSWCCSKTKIISRHKGRCTAAAVYKMVRPSVSVGILLLLLCFEDQADIFPYFYFRVDHTILTKFISA